MNNASHWRSQGFVFGICILPYTVLAALYSFGHYTVDLVSLSWWERNLAVHCSRGKSSPFQSLINIWRKCKENLKDQNKEPRSKDFIVEDPFMKNS